MKICFVLPRNMSFSPATATSIDLCVHDLVNFSAYRDSTTVVGEPADNPFNDLDFLAVPRRTLGGQAGYAKDLAKALAPLSPDIVVVQQHSETAANIAKRLPGTAVFLQRHGMSPDYRSLWYRLRYAPQYRRMARVICVSQALAENVKTNFPDIASKVAVVLNGIDTTLWLPAEKEKRIVFAGRAVVEKGVEELSEALAILLARHPDWRASLLLAAAPRDAATVAKMKAVLAPVLTKIHWRENAPLDEVRVEFSKAAIALVPSIMREGFGRTAMEAHAAGAAVISSGRGALREVSGDAALYLPEISADAIVTATETLIASPEEVSKFQMLSRQRASEALDIRACGKAFDSLCETVMAEQRKR